MVVSTEEGMTSCGAGSPSTPATEDNDGVQILGNHNTTTTTAPLHNPTTTTTIDTHDEEVQVSSSATAKDRCPGRWLGGWRRGDMVGVGSDVFLPILLLVVTVRIFYLSYSNTMTTPAWEDTLVVLPRWCVGIVERNWIASCSTYMTSYSNFMIYLIST